MQHFPYVVAWDATATLLAKYQTVCSAVFFWLQSEIVSSVHSFSILNFLHPWFCTPEIQARKEFDALLCGAVEYGLV